MIISKDLLKPKLRWLQACIILGGLIILPLGLTNARDTGTGETGSGVNEAATRDAMRELKEQQRFPELMLGEIKRAAEEYDVRLISLKQNGTRLDIEGIAPSNELIAAFMKNLDSSSLFQDTPTLTSLRRRWEEDQVVSDFHIYIFLNFNPESILKDMPREILQEIVLEDRDIPDILVKSTEIMTKTGVDVSMFRPVRSVKRDGYSEIPIWINAEGTYENIIKAMSSLREIDRFLMFKNINVRPDKSNSNVILSMQLVAYNTLPPDNSDKSNIIINLTKEGEIFIQGEKIDLSTIKSRVENFKNEYPDGNVIITCDKDSFNKKAIEVLEQVRAANVKNVVVASEK